MLTRPDRIVLLTIAVAAAVRVLLAATIGPGVDEAYDVVLSRAPSLAYFDHPPLSFWITGLVARLAGTERMLPVRLPIVLLFAGTTWLLYRLGARLYGAWAGAWGAVALNVSPVFAVPIGGWVLPDGPLVFFMVLAALCTARALFGATRGATTWWVAAGFATGLAALSKYHAIFVPVGVLLYLLTRREARRWLVAPGPYLAAAIAAVMFTPVILWNARHGWASFAFQGTRGAGRPGVHPLAMLGAIGGQAAYLLPWIWLPLLWVLVAGIARGPRDAHRWFLCCLAIGPIALFTLVALGGRPGLPHWPAPGYLMLFPLLGAAIAQRLQRGDRRVRIWLASSTAAFALLLALFATQAATGWVGRLAPGLLRRGDPTSEVLDWRDLRDAIARGHLLDAGTFVAAPSWITGAKISYALGPRVPVLCLCDAPHHFAYLRDTRDFVGQDALLVVRADRAPTTAARLAPSFTSLVPVAWVPIRRAGRVEMVLALLRGKAWGGGPPPPVPR